VKSELLTAGGSRDGVQGALRNGAASHNGTECVLKDAAGSRDEVQGALRNGAASFLAQATHGVSLASRPPLQ
jgi:hypothetical protein